MSCPSTFEILELVSGRLSADQNVLLQQHFRGCTGCRSAAEQLGGTSRMLGDWEVDSRGRNLVSGVLAGVERDRQVPAVFSARRLTAMRIAASVLIAVGMGIVAGTALPVKNAQVQPLSASPVSPEQVEQAIGLSDLGRAAATGLAGGLEDGLASADAGGLR
jgi:predicted anti-sigma-YlaC factor YlaD